ncbi:MAG: phytoene desaturase, partial [Crocinitomicaceae bacterium]|nr:phytoene desaturase [Crocinitomicaceae bacterium]
MHKIVDAMKSLAEEKGVVISLNESVQSIEVVDGFATKIVTNSREVEADIVIGGADYHHVEQKLITPEYRTYSKKYWDKRVLAPSCIIFYCGLNKKLKNVQHHNLFFDEDFNQHAQEIYDEPQWPSSPLFYVSVPSITDPSVAPEGMENMFILIPVAPGLSNDNEELREKYFNIAVARFENLTNQKIKENIIYKRSYAYSNFVEDYNAFKGNAYGLANTLKQTAILKPSIKSKKVKNIYFTGQLTVPGPGVPPAIISGQVVAAEITKDYVI